MAVDTGIVWFRQDLRLADHEALHAAVAAHGRLLPVYVWAPAQEGGWSPGAATRWWLHDSLTALRQDLVAKGSDLVLRNGDPGSAMRELAKKTGASVVYASRRFEPAAKKQEEAVRGLLEKAGIALKLYDGALLHDPQSVFNQAKTPYLVYGAFWRAVQARRVAPPLPAPGRLPPLPDLLRDERAFAEVLASWELKPKISWDAGLRAAWRAGETEAHRKLGVFCEDRIAEYAVGRDLPGSPGTSRLSPHLHFGELSPRQAWSVASKSKGEGSKIFLKELVWREFSYYLLHHHPYLESEPLRSEFAAFPWEANDVWLAAWQRGRTGYPIVDAGMRELWHTGWMHNRVRMIVASFLVKDLRIHWLEGAKWFWDTLVDADLASNTQGWQWTAGCGADAAPYFRVFNPMLQGKRFDPEGTYVRRWVPEVASRGKSQVHDPYGTPVVDHDRARFQALMAFERIKRKK